MPGFVVSGLVALLVVLALALLWRTRRDRDAARAEADALRAAHAVRERSFGLLAREMQSLGLALLGHAGGGRDQAAAAAT